MKVIKRSGVEVDFSSAKIRDAITKANNSVGKDEQITPQQIEQVAATVEQHGINLGRALSVEEIQDLVETELMRLKAYALAKSYIKYRFWREGVRKKNTTDDRILALIDNKNEEVKQENSNKNPTVASVQRDYIAGEVSRDLTKRYLMAEDLMDAHERGLIHIHDTDYYIQHMFNCCLINLEDMLQNGTVISGTKIEKPHSFYTACNVTTQIVAQVASNQYGGQTFTLSHLAPFVDVSRQRIKKEVENELIEAFHGELPSDYDATVDSIVRGRLKEEIRRGVQTIQYQVITLMTTNG